jgi:Flp pilus assembly protein TadG
MSAPTPIHPAPARARLRRLFGSRRGSALIMTTVAIVALLSFAIIAIDGAMLLTTKGQLQKAADSAALAGASGLINGSQTIARTRAIAFASYNKAVRNTLEPVGITAGDVTFPQSNHCRVTTHRTAATGDALRTYFLRVIALGRANTADVTAVAEAYAYDVCSTPCLKPWAIPDRWNDANLNNTWDPGEYYDPIATGYKVPSDVGLQVILKVGNANDTMTRSQFYPVDYPPRNYPGGPAPITGGSAYRDWIAGCCPYTVGPGDQLQTEQGAKTGPTTQGCRDLIAQDPLARWNPVTKKVEGSAFGTSPRVALVPFFDPTLSPGSGRNWVTVTKVGAFFIEGVVAGNVVGRYIESVAQGAACPGGGLNVNGGFIKGIALIQ